LLRHLRRSHVRAGRVQRTIVQRLGIKPSRLATSCASFLFVLFVGLPNGATPRRIPLRHGLEACMCLPHRQAQIGRTMPAPLALSPSDRYREASCQFAMAK
jgi:hypothetical protein